VEELMARKIQGVFCERKGKLTKARCATGSFRYGRSGSAWLLYCCPKGEWDPGRYVYRIKNGKRRRTRGKCAVGIQTHKLLVPARKGVRCKPGEKRIRK
jgi:hypothetical protein